MPNDKNDEPADGPTVRRWMRDFEARLWRFAESMARADELAEIMARADEQRDPETRRTMIGDPEPATFAAAGAHPMAPGLATPASNERPFAGAAAGYWSTIRGQRSLLAAEASEIRAPRFVEVGPGAFFSTLPDDVSKAPAVAAYRRLGAEKLMAAQESARLWQLAEQGQRVPRVSLSSWLARDPEVGPVASEWPEATR